MNGIICWHCLILAILALLLASQRWRNELNKNQEKDVSQPNHDIWWIWPQERLRSCLLQLLQTRGGLRMDIMNLNNLFLTIERGDPLKRQDQTTLRNMVHPGLLKCGKVEMESTIDQGNLTKILGIHWEKLTLIVENIFSAGRRILQGTKKLFTKERGDPIQRIPRKRPILKSSSWEVTQQNLLTKSRTKREFDRKECPIMQKIVPNIR